MKYISIDLDEPDLLAITVAWFGVKQHGGNGPFGRVSSSGNGVHIRNTDVLPENVPVELERRLSLGDDYRRAMMDNDHPHEPNQLLFDYKYGKSPGRWTDDLDQLVQWYRYGVGK